MKKIKSTYVLVTFLVASLLILSACFLLGTISVFGNDSFADAAEELSAFVYVDGQLLEGESVSLQANQSAVFTVAYNGQFYTPEISTEDKVLINIDGSKLTVVDKCKLGAFTLNLYYSFEDGQEFKETVKVCVCAVEEPATVVENGFGTTVCIYLLF